MAAVSGLELKRGVAPVLGSCVDTAWILRGSCVDPACPGEDSEHEGTIRGTACPDPGPRPWPAKGIVPVVDPDPAGGCSKL